jgi:signal transduction histidine kinase/ABC-type uncharacterized transport system substrate-binding protein
MRTILLYCWILSLVAISADAQETNPSAGKKVLVLHSQHETFHWTHQLDHAIREGFSRAPFDIHPYIEYMDTRRFSTQALFPQLRDLYQIKYRAIKLDLILITDNAAFDFLAAYRDELFPQVPVVFCGLNNYTPDMIDRRKNLTGILEDFDLEGTLELILTIQPKVKTIGVVSDASDTGRLHRQRFLGIRPLFEKRVAFQDIASLDEGQVVQQIQKMPDESAVIVLSYHLDPKGKFFSVREGLDVLQKGGRPLYSFWETSLGEGIVGGVITNARRHGLDAAKMGIEILKGKKTAEIPVQSCTNLPMFDYAYLQRFKIDQALLPNNSIIINQPDSFYSRYRKLIIAVLGIFAVMSCLIVGLMINIIDRKRAEKEIQTLNQELEERVVSRTAQLEAANRELEGFVYSISHDLRAPLRHIDGFIELLRKQAGSSLDEQGRHYMDTISDAAIKLGRLIDDLLAFSRMGRHAMSPKPVDLGSLVQRVIRELEPETIGREIIWCIGDLPVVLGDAAMLRIVLTNLIANALKFTRPRKKAHIEIDSLPGRNGEAVIFVRDNGVGFDMAYADKLFGVFQRLHRSDEFEGTGIGLASVDRIIKRHKGRAWAEGKLEQGAAFFFSLPQELQRGRYANI